MYFLCHNPSAHQSMAHGECSEKSLWNCIKKQEQEFIEELDLDRIDWAHREVSWETREEPGHGGLSVGKKRELTMAYLM